MRKSSTRLLRTVGNKPHATQADHHDVLPTPPATNSTRSSGSHGKAAQDEEKEEDIYGDPFSSEDERPPFVKATNLDGAQDELPRAASFQQARTFVPSPDRAKVAWKQPSRPSLRSPESTASKRSNGSEEQGSSDADGPVFSSQGSTKRAKTARPNIHATDRKPKNLYGKKAAQRSSQKDFKHPTKTNDKKAVEEPKQPTFQLAKGVNDVFHFRGEQTQQAEFKTLDESADAGVRNSLSPSLSSLSSVPDSPEVEEIAMFNLPAAKPYCATVDCDICGVTVDKLLKENFEDEFTHGKPMNFRSQQRFCRHHQQETAKEVWKERSYPEIDWARLETRMCKFDDHLRDVMCNRVASDFKHELKKHLRPSKSKFPEVRAAVDAQEVVTKAWTGYYGPRGEKAMTDHIVAHLSDDLRERASKDRIVAASGVKGGMSGFVHSVLMPELACRLIAEDLGVQPEGAREVLGRSADMGVLLNPELEENVRGSGGRDDDEMDTDG